MARMRTLKPGFFSNDLLAEMPPVTRLLFAGLWCIADREGRLEDRPKRIKAEVLPYDNVNVDRLLDDLALRGFILRFESQESRFIQVLAFAKHQNPHVREPASTIPAPGEHSASPMPDPDPHSNGTGPAVSARVLGHESWDPVLDHESQEQEPESPRRPPQGAHTDSAKPEKASRRTKTAGEHRPITDQDVAELVAKFTPLFGLERKVRLSIDKALNSRARSTWLNERLGVDVWLRGDLEKLRETGKAPRFPMAVPEAADDDGPFEPEDKPMCGTCGVSAAVDLAGTTCRVCMVKQHHAARGKIA